MGHIRSYSQTCLFGFWGAFSYIFMVLLVTILGEKGLAKYFNVPEKKYYNEKIIFFAFSSFLFVKDMYKIY